MALCLCLSIVLSTFLFAIYSIYLSNYFDVNKAFNDTKAKGNAEDLLTVMKGLVSFFTTNPKTLDYLDGKEKHLGEEFRDKMVKVKSWIIPIAVILSLTITLVIKFGITR